MDDINFFDSIAYFSKLCKMNKLAQKEEFYPCVCTGIDNLEGLLEEFRRVSAFMAIEDTNDGSTERRSGGFFRKRVFTIFLLKRYTYDDMEDRAKALDICRQLFRQIHSRLLQAKESEDDLQYMNVEQIYSRELSRYFLSGCTGLYFMVEVSEPINLVYNTAEWDETE